MVRLGVAKKSGFLEGLVHHQVDLSFLICTGSHLGGVTREPPLPSKCCWRIAVGDRCPHCEHLVPIVRERTHARVHIHTRTHTNKVFRMR